MAAAPALQTVDVKQIANICTVLLSGNRQWVRRSRGSVLHHVGSQMAGKSHDGCETRQYVEMLVRMLLTSNQLHSNQSAADHQPSKCALLGLRLRAGSQCRARRRGRRRRAAHCNRSSRASPHRPPPPAGGSTVARCPNSLTYANGDPERGSITSQGF